MFNIFFSLGCFQRITRLHSIFLFVPPTHIRCRHIRLFCLCEILLSPRDLIASEILDAIFSFFVIFHFFKQNLTNTSFENNFMGNFWPEQHYKTPLPAIVFYFRLSAKHGSACVSSSGVWVCHFLMLLDEYLKYL